MAQVGDSTITEAILEVGEIRHTLGPRKEFRKADRLDKLADALEKTRYLRREPIVQKFIEDLRGFADDPRLVLTKRHINHKLDNRIFSLFDASYFPSLSLDYMTYRELPTDASLVRRYPSNTMPVIIEHMSEGFDSRVVVALFPENHLDRLQLGDDLIFYFINKFVERHKRLTRRLVSEVMFDDSFRLVRAASDADIERASSWWVRLHEFHHRQGDMPIPEYLSVKSLKPLAGLEELRVDVSGMLVCLHDEALLARDAALTFEYILAERLLRYAVEGIPRPNYDAVASQLFFNYLLSSGGIHVRNEIIHLDPALPEVLAQFLEEIQGIERLIQIESAEAVQQRLLGFTNRYTNFDDELQDYRHIPYFAVIKERLGV